MMKPHPAATNARPRRQGIMLAAALTASGLVFLAALTGVITPDKPAQLVGQWWFIALALALALLALATATGAVLRRPVGWPGITLVHLGFAVGIAGILLNQTADKSGYLFLETAGAPKRYQLSRDQRRVEPLRFALRLDSIRQVDFRGFRPAPVLWLSTDVGHAALTWNRPLSFSGRRPLLLRLTGPGFPHELQIRVQPQAADHPPEEFLLLYQQRIRLRSGQRLTSFGYDPASGEIGISLDERSVWLRPGSSALVDGINITLLSASVASRPGALLLLGDVRFRPVIFCGFGLSLAGLALLLFRKKPG